MKEDKAHIIETVGKKVSDHFRKRLYCSDIHIDSKECEKSMFREHLKEADKVAIFGDLFDVMQSHWDKRKSHSDAKERADNKAYIDGVIDDAVEFLEPFKDKIEFISDGNHETKIIQMCGVDPIANLIYKLNPKIQHGQYQGFIVNRARHDDSGRCFKNPLVTYFHHGGGGNAKRSKGMLDNQMDGFLAPQADMIVKGDNHWKYLDPSNTRLKLDAKFNIVESDQYCLRLGSYKKSKRSGWATEKGFMPSKRGGWFVEMGLVSDHLKIGKIYEAK